MTICFELGYRQTFDWDEWSKTGIERNKERIRYINQCFIVRLPCLYWYQQPWQTLADLPGYSLNIAFTFNNTCTGPLCRGLF